MWLNHDIGVAVARHGCRGRFADASTSPRSFVSIARMPGLVFSPSTRSTGIFIRSASAHPNGSERRLFAKRGAVVRALSMRVCLRHSGKESKVPGRSSSYMARTIASGSCPASIFARIFALDAARPCTCSWPPGHDGQSE